MSLALRDYRRGLSVASSNPAAQLRFNLLVDLPWTRDGGIFFRDGHLSFALFCVILGVNLLKVTGSIQLQCYAEILKCVSSCA